MKKFIIPLITAALLLPALSAHATYRSDNRQDARNIRQDSREEGRDTKQQCVRDNNKSNAGCRQDKRENRRDGRQDARDEKWWSTDKNSRCVVNTPAITQVKIYIL